MSGGDRLLTSVVRALYERVGDLRARADALDAQADATRRLADVLRTTASEIDAYVRQYLESQPTRRPLGVQAIVPSQRREP